MQINTSPSRIDLGAFLERALAGLADLEEVRLLAYLLLHEIIQISPTAVAARLDDPAMLEGLKVTMADPALKKEASASDIQRMVSHRLREVEVDDKADLDPIHLTQEEAQKSCVKIVVELYALSSPSQQPRFTEAIRPYVTGPKWSSTFKG